MFQTTAELADRRSDLRERLEAARRLNQIMLRLHNAAAENGHLT